MLRDRCFVLSVLFVYNVGVYGSIDQDATWYGGRPRLRRHCVRLGASSPRKGAQQPPTFLPALLWRGGPSQQQLSSCFTEKQLHV